MGVWGGWAENCAVTRSCALHILVDSLCLSLSCAELSSTMHAQGMGRGFTAHAQAALVSGSEPFLYCHTL